MRFIHTTCSYLKTTWVKAIENVNHALLPGLTKTIVYQYLPSEILTIQGYHHQLRQRIRSTMARAAMAKLALEASVHETHSKVVELPYLDAQTKMESV